MTTNLHDKMLAAIDALFSASNEIEAHEAEQQLLDVRDELLKHKRAEQFCDNHCTWLDHHPDCDKAEQPAQQEPSPTAGMNIAQRILHVGGRNNAAGYVEFGSIQAVKALICHVLRDQPAQRKPLTDEQIYAMYNEPRSDAEMIAFARAIEAAHGITKGST